MPSIPRKLPEQSSVAPTKAVDIQDSQAETSEHGGRDGKRAWLGDRQSSMSAAQPSSSVLKYEFPRGRLPALKVPDPKYLVDRLRAGDTAALLSRRKRSERVDEPQALINEIDAKRFEDAFVWAVVSQEAPVAVASMAALSEDQLASLDSFTRDEFSPEKGIWYLPLKLLAVFEPPLKLKAPPPGRRYGGEVDFRSDVEKAGLSVTALVGSPNPAILRSATNEKLRQLEEELIAWYTEYFAGTDAASGGGASRENVLNAYIFVWAELERRGLQPKGEDPRQLADLEKAQVGSKFAAINPSGVGQHQDDPARLDEVLEHWCKPMALRMPAVILVGSICNHGASANDIDVLVRGPLDEETRHIIKFRLGRALPPRLSERVQFHDDTQGGPFTAHVPLYDLVLVPHQDRSCIQMSEVRMQDDPLLDWPKTLGKRPGILQAHFRGKGYHLDFRTKVADYLVGWTLAVMKPGASGDVSTVEEARRVMAPFDMLGSAVNKPMILPSRIYAVPKSRQPVEWLTIGDRVFEPGSVGATRFEPGVYVELAKLNVEWGKQDPHFHEYFITGAPNFGGTLAFRMLEGGGTPNADEGMTGEGETFWTSGFTKVPLPSVLRRHAVTTGAMPPLGQSAMPQDLMRITPREFRFWEADSEAEARKVRDALVDSHFFTETNVRFTDGRYQRVGAKRLFDAPDVERLTKAARTVDFVLSWQYWKGQTVIRATPSRQIYHLLIPSRDAGDVQDFQLQTDPLAGDESVSAVLRAVGPELMRFEGDATPGLEVGGLNLNTTKATPSSVKIIDRGKVDILDEQGTFKKLRFRGKKLKGIFTLVAEEAGSTIWIFAPGEAPNRNIPVEKVFTVQADGTQVWDLEDRLAEDDKGEDRNALRPPAVFQPMKPAARASTRFTDPDVAARDVFSDEIVRDGVIVEPKFNGFRTIAMRWNADPQRGVKTDGVMVFTEDAKRDLAKNLPNLTRDLEKLGGEFIIDGEMMAVEPGTRDSFLPRADLAQFRGDHEADDTNLRFVAFDMLYHPTHGNITTRPTNERQALLRAWLASKDVSHVVVDKDWTATTRSRLRELIGLASKEPGSEGAMLKAASSTYSLGGENDLWAKVKTTRIVRALVVARHEVKDSPGVYNFVGAIGPIDDPENWAEPVEHAGKQWATIGRTGNRKLDANIGDVIEVASLEFFFKDSPPKRLRWFGPAHALDKVEGAPTSIADLKGLLRPGELEGDKVAKSERAIRIVKAEDVQEEHFIFGVVLVPDEPDAHGDIYSAEDVRKAAHSFLEFYGGVHKVMHQGEPVEGLKVLESYLSKVEEQHGEETFPVGTWFLASRVNDEKLWEAIKAGKFTGYSMGGTALREKVSRFENGGI